jgi:hypothetical protein
MLDLGTATTSGHFHLYYGYNAFDPDLEPLNAQRKWELITTLAVISQVAAITAITLSVTQS